MPFKSEAQRRYLWANRPDIAKRWAEKYGTKALKKRAIERLKNASHSHNSKR